MPCSDVPGLFLCLCRCTYLNVPQGRGWCGVWSRRNAHQRRCRHLWHPGRGFRGPWLRKFGLFPPPQRFFGLLRGFLISPGGGGGQIDMCPNNRGDQRRPTSARWSARPFPLIPMWDRTCSHLTSSHSRSVSSTISSHRSTCLTEPEVLCHLCRRHRWAHPSTPFTTNRESGHIRDRCPGMCPCRLRRAALSSPRLLVCSSFSGMYSTVSLWSPNDTPYPPTHPTSGCFSAYPDG